MYTGLVHLHNLLRWIILVLLVLNIIRHLMAAAQPFGNTDKKLGLWLMITAHITLLLGLYQYFAGNFGFKLIKEYGMAEAMKISSVRFWAVEHITGMIVAIALITVGRGIFRKAIPDAAKHKRALILYGLALALILAIVPWPFRDGVARPWFPGM
jgi:hypothetical protein